MRIIWVEVNKRFELENCTYDEREFPNEARWKWDGGVWWTTTPARVVALRGQKPPSGLSITRDAFTRIEPTLSKPARVRKPRKQTEPQGNRMQRTIPDGLQIPAIPRYVPPVFAGPWCVKCNGPVYFYELQTPPTCLWCEMHDRVDATPTLA